MDTLRVTLLGGCEFRWQSGARLVFRIKKAQSLLAYLALRPGESVSREKLAGLLWSDRGEQQAHGSLRQTLSYLRKIFEPFAQSPLIVKNSHIALDASMLDVDALAFNKLAGRGTDADLERALDLYKGDLFDGFNINDPAFEDWLEQTRREYRQSFLRTAGLVFQNHASNGNSGQAINLGQRLLDADPLQEDVLRQLMQLYADQGQANAALKQFEICKDCLKRELGVLPDPDTVELADHIRQERLNSEQNDHDGGKVISTALQSSRQIGRNLPLRQPKRLAWHALALTMAAGLLFAFVWFKPWIGHEVLYKPPTTDVLAFEAFLKAEELRLTCKAAHYAEAQSNYEEALKRDPDFVAALVGQASLARDAWRYGYRIAIITPNFKKRAIALVNRALELSPHHSAALKLHIEMLLDTAQHELALKMARRAIADKANDSLLQQALARTYLAIGEREKAHVASLRALSLAPSTDWMQLLDIARNFAFLGDYEKAVLLAEKALKLGGNPFRIAFTLGPAYAGLGRIDKAAAQIEIIQRDLYAVTTTELGRTLAYIQDKDIVSDYMKSFELAGMPR